MNLYSILDLGYVNENQVVDCATSICRSGVVKLQLRAKSIEPKKIFNLAKMVKPICNDYSIPLIINDYPEIAASIGADGVHIGQEDGEIKKVRAIIGDNKIVGRSTHSIEQVRAAISEGADYIGFGPLYETGTKPGRPAIGLNDIVQANQEFNGNVYCIGGINEKTITDVIAVSYTHLTLPTKA